MDSAPGAHWRILRVAEARAAAALGRGMGAARNSSASSLAIGGVLNRRGRAHTGSADLAAKEGRIQRAPLTRRHLHWREQAALQEAGRFHKSSLKHSFSFPSDLSDSMALASLQACGFRSNKSVMTPNTCPYFVFSIDISLR